MTRLRRILARPARLRDERGFTLIEMLVGATVGLVVLAASLLVIEDSVKLARVTDQRVDVTQRGRDAMETVVRELRSQVCLGTTASLSDATDSSVTYYVNLGGVDAVPERHELALSGTSLVLRRWVGTGTPPALTFAVAPSSTRTLLENVQAIPGTPIFRYFAWTAGATVTPTTLLATPLAAADLPRTVKVAVSFRVNPADDFRSNSTRADLHDSVFSRNADPTDPTRGPQCN